MINAKKSTLVIVVGLAMLAGVYLAIFAGNLEPPGPPAPTMKTLDEIETRIPIHAADLPLTITAPGNYYLAEDITTAGGGITVSKGLQNVSIDMKGHSLTGGTGAGINVSGTVKNGTVSGWALHGVSAFVVIDVRSTGNTGDGIIASRECIRCIASSNGGNGIRMNGQVRVVDSTSSGNTSNGFITTGAASVITNCTANSNGVDGFHISSGSPSMILNSVATFNDNDGIEVSDNAYVFGNLCNGNNDVFGQDGAGIFVIGSGNRIEGNNIRSSNRGIDVDGTGNLVIRNSVSTVFGTRYDIVAGNTVGTIVTTGAAMNSATNDLVNIEY